MGPSFLKGCGVGLVLLGTAVTAAPATPAELNDAVSLGLASTMKQASVLTVYATLLNETIAGGDLEAAKEAYALARPPYEQIEVLAASFSDIDCAIDCRPYSFTHGDASPEFVGFHKIEGLLYRDGDTAGAVSYADTLLNDCIALEEALTKMSSFSPDLTWGGMIGLAQEVVAKKLSGEEETYSGLSLLILHENWLGISSLYAPFHELVVERSPEAAAEVILALESAMTTAGVYRNGANSWQKFEELDNYELLIITEASQRVVDALRAAAALILPPTEEIEETLAPTAAPTSAPIGETPDDTATDMFTLFGDLATTMAAEVDALGVAIRGGDLSLARQAYEGARPSYEQIEVLALCFPDIDGDIDARPYTFELGETDPAFKGFHKIERALFRDGNMTAAEIYVDQLADSTDQLIEALSSSSCNTIQQFEGMIGLSLEIGSKKISGEEEAFSDLSVLIFESNWKGIATVYEPYAAGSPEADVAVKAAFEQCDAAIASVKENNTDDDLPLAFTGSDYPSYRGVPMTFRAAVVNCTYALAAALSDAATEQELIPEDNVYHANSFFKYKAPAVVPV